MLLLDVNVLIAAFRPEMPHHLDVKRWLEWLIAEDRPFGVVDALASSFVRVTTQKPFSTPISLALDFMNRVREAPSCWFIAPNPAQWAIFDRICRATRRHGKGAQDAYWASF